MLRKYQQSLKNVNHLKNSRFNRPLRPITADIFSQAPEQDSSYMIDSFVVEDADVDQSNGFSSIFKLIENLKINNFLPTIDEDEENENFSGLSKNKTTEDSLIAELLTENNKTSPVVRKKLKRVRRIADDTTYLDDNSKTTTVSKITVNCKPADLVSNNKNSVKKAWLIVDREQMGFSAVNRLFLNF
jgi:hypothetical protein